MDTRSYCSSIQNTIVQELVDTGRAYLKTGIQLFHQIRHTPSIPIEPAIGNLSIAIEILLKALIASYNLVLLFNDLPFEIRVLFTCPEKIPPESINLRRYQSEILAYSYKTPELDEVITRFFVIFPQQRQALRPYFRLLARCRNASLHFSLPSFHRFELERTAYLALQVTRILDDSKDLAFFYFLNAEDKKFLAEYDEERVNRVRKIIEAAKERSAGLESQEVAVEDDLEKLKIKCPVCGCDSLLYGANQIEAEGDEDGLLHPYLEFLADSFECFGCGLKLGDVKELELAGLETSYVRSQDETDEWYIENGFDNIRDIDYP